MPVRHHWVVRVTHWTTAIAFFILVGSGLRIFAAYPRFARRGETFCCNPFEASGLPAWVQHLWFGGWLAGARNWHFAMMWVLALSGVVYVVFVYLHGEWRTLAPRRGDLRDAWEMAKFYLFVRKDHPVQGKHNALQKLAYFSMPVAMSLAILTGLAIWKPVQLGWLTSLFGGYVWARYWHFVIMLVLVVLVALHVFMVLTVDPYSLRAMLTGGWNPRTSPEARNARPFFWKRRRAEAAEPAHDPERVEVGR
jgi:Ni/Fe-hydrogenase b-type cytochrome subunit